MKKKYLSVVLRPGKEKSLKRYHPWIFSGAIQTSPELQPGDIAAVLSANKELLGHAYFNPRCSLIGRMLSFGDADPFIVIEQALQNAIQQRQTFMPAATNAYRLVNGEADALPGLIVDQYDDVLVMQVMTAGMEAIRAFVVEQLVQLCRPRAIYEKSLGFSRQIEGLTDSTGCLYGAVPDVLIIKENNLKFKVDIINGQKTGLFLDQREMRSLVETLAKDRKLLNCFGYNGGFSLYAMRGGAQKVDIVDVSAPAIASAKENAELNGYGNNFRPLDNYLVENVFSYLQKEIQGQYDFIILDPPAFAKKKADVKNACKGYQQLNRLAFSSIASNSLLLTASCSYYIDETLFQQLVFQAALDAGREVQIIQKHRLAMDHPISLYHPEGSYLKSLLLYVK